MNNEVDERDDEYDNNEHDNENTDEHDDDEYAVKHDYDKMKIIIIFMNRLMKMVVMMMTFYLFCSCPSR